MYELHCRVFMYLYLLNAMYMWNQIDKLHNHTEACAILTDALLGFLANQMVVLTFVTWLGG